MTPWQLSACEQAHIEEKNDSHNRFAWFMWHCAALFRYKGKKIPDIDLFMIKDKGDSSKGGGKKPVSGVNEDAIMAWLTAAKAAHHAKKDKK